MVFSLRSNNLPIKIKLINMPFFSGVFKELRILHHQHQCHDIVFRNAAAWAVITTNVLVGLTFVFLPLLRNTAHLVSFQYVTQA